MSATNNLLNTDNLFNNNFAYEYLFLTSADRDTSSYPYVNNFSVKSSKKFQDIRSLEIVQIKFPTTTISEDVLFLSLSDTAPMTKMSSTDNSLISGKSCIALFPNGGNLPPNALLTIPMPIIDINRFDIKVYKSDGTYYNFGESSGDLQPHKQLSILLKVNYV